MSRITVAFHVGCDEDSRPRVVVGEVYLLDEVVLRVEIAAGRASAVAPATQEAILAAVREAMGPALEEALEQLGTLVAHKGLAL